METEPRSYPKLDASCQKPISRRLSSITRRLSSVSRRQATTWTDVALGRPDSVRRDAPGTDGNATTPAFCNHPRSSSHCAHGSSRIPPSPFSPPQFLPRLTDSSLAPSLAASLPPLLSQARLLPPGSPTGLGLAYLACTQPRLYHISCD
jgi:hypothetical protein